MVRESQQLHPNNRSSYLVVVDVTIQSAGWVFVAMWLKLGGAGRRKVLHG